MVRERGDDGKGNRLNQRRRIGERRERNEKKEHLSTREQLEIAEEEERERRFFDSQTGDND